MNSSQSKISLFLMTKKGFEVLQGLVDNGLKECIDKVIIGKDNNVIQDYAIEILNLCQSQSINFCFRDKYVDDNNSSYLIAISWRWLIHSNTKLIVLHDSILPKYRGFAPLVNMLINGEEKIGVTALFALEEYDKGPIIDQRLVAIKYPIKISEAIDKIAALYVELCVTIVETIQMGKELTAIPQKEELASYSLWRDEEDYCINWHQDATTISRFIDAVGYPFNGAQTWIKGQKVIVREAIEVEDKKIENRAIGKVIFIDEEGRPTIVCGKGLIKIIAADYADNLESIIPLKQFRLRFNSNEST